MLDVTRQEDPKTDLANQLKCLELSLDLLLTLLNVDGQTVFQKSCVFKTEVKKRLRDLDFGAALFRITKDRPSLLAVDYAHRLIKELRLELMPDSRSQAEGVTAGKPGSYKSSPRSKTQISTRMIGTSSSIPRSAHPAWEHPHASTPTTSLLPRAKSLRCLFDDPGDRHKHTGGANSRNTT